MTNRPPSGAVKGPYTQKSVKGRLEAFFLDNIGLVITNTMIKAVAMKEDGTVPENWHQRLSELRTDLGYTILTNRDRDFLAVGEYLLETAEKRELAGGRILPTPETWMAVLNRANNKCEWTEGGHVCNLANGDIDPIGGGRVKLTPDHKTPHSVNPNSDPADQNQWQALCGRHQVVKKNYWDSNTGKLNTEAVLQSLPHKEKQLALKFLLDYFGLKAAPLAAVKESP